MEQGGCHTQETALKCLFKGHKVFVDHLSQVNKIDLFVEKCVAGVLIYIYMIKKDGYNNKQE